MDMRDITVVVQGPVHSYQQRAMDDNITKQCLASVRQFLPKAHIILSTWPEQDLSGLDYDELIINPDPGSNIRYYTDKHKPKGLNNNRQIVSTLNGLKAVKTKYAIKLRSDNYLTSAEFVNLFNRYQTRCDGPSVFKQRIVIPNTFSRKYAKGLPVAFHLSDFFYFGLTEDLLKLWDIPLLKNYDLEAQGIPSPGYPNYPIDCTQMFWQEGLKNFTFNTQLGHLHDLSHDKLHLSEQFIANNLIIAAPEEIGLGLCDKFLGQARVNRVRGKSSFYQLSDWLNLYRQYCDAQQPMKVSARLLLWLQRLVYVYPVMLETRFKLKKRHRRFNKRLNQTDDSSI